MKTNSRRTAAYIIVRWLITKEFPQTMLPSGSDRAFVQDLVYTVLRRLRALRKVLGELVKTWPKGELEALLYVGAAQILYMDDVPDFAAVNETVEAAKACENKSIARVVNGTLRNLIRRKEEFLARLASASIETRESFPTAIVKRWQARFGEAQTEQLCQWHNLPAETYLARKDGSFVKLERGRRVNEVEGYDDGDFIVQDPGTGLAIELMAVKAGERVLDACAAPGGKTIQLSWRGALVTACEVNPKRRRRLEENLTRLNLPVKTVGSLDEASTLGEGFQKVLVDAPCSNTGVFRRRPDARWNWTEEKLSALVRLQAEILDQAAKAVVSGGTLVYSTCSVEAEENELQVRAFLERHPEFKLVESRFSLPVETHFDGAFAAALQKQ